MLGGWVWEALQASKALVANGDNSTLGQHVVLSQKKRNFQDQQLHVQNEQTCSDGDKTACSLFQDIYVCGVTDSLLQEEGG